MEPIKCPSCGAPIDPVLIRGSLVKCEFCGSTQKTDFRSKFNIDEQQNKTYDAINSKKVDEARNNDRLYNSAIELANKGDWYSTKQAINLLSSIPDWRDSNYQLEECKNKLSKELERKQLQDQVIKVAEKKNNIGKTLYLLSFILIPSFIALALWLALKGCGVH